ncbi:hypothetical protein GCM10010251_46080 [Streptomyces aurantiogriseus]|uniref:Uncharacterized protein n=1 Tax=Streptomyces aurantiogriseus TaxID=66870 RepID=A0A918FBQ9_9ACTN|nr:hypothetical protein [Streptomyces aurantiogriseus]GGR24776.1 hypothetical protein GCM10010251_46080 [Streptomyces aurantiogriseus]
MSGRTVRRGAVLGLGALWWWAAVRTAVAPDAGVVEGAVAAGGWGLSLLPVHCVAKARAAGAVAAGRWRAAWRGEAGGAAAGLEGAAGERGEGALEGGWVTPTKAWPRRRSGGGSGPS